ncbi:MAG: hypothetical protein ACKVOQ_20955 [Cyclobacteriaceae bacterium]
MKDRTRIVLILICGLAALALLYVFQRTSYGLILFQALGLTPNENLIFIINKTLRLLANDFVCVVMIFSIFKEKNYRQVTLAVFLIEFVVILPFYFLLKLNLEGSSELSSPLLSFIHRLIVNPTLMILTGMALAYQKFVFPTLRK